MIRLYLIFFKVFFKLFVRSCNLLEYVPDIGYNIYDIYDSTLSLIRNQLYMILHYPHSILFFFLFLIEYNNFLDNNE